MREFKVFVDRPGHRYDFETPVATIGNFDGVHKGHQRILTAVTLRTRTHRGTALVITFNPHPSAFFGRGSFKALVTESQKMRILRAMGIDAVIQVPFTRALAEETAEEFARDLLVERLRIQELYVGNAFRLGKDRMGDVAALQSIGAMFGFSAFGIEPVYEGGGLVSSTRIRDDIERGDIRDANRCLGRPYTVEGTVVRGRRRGRALGYPTANLALENELLPVPGVYATRCVTKGRRFDGATFIGPRPTFGEVDVTVETFILDETIKLYGETMELDFIDRLRGVWKFDTPEALIAQIKLDVEQARTVLGNSG